jgi:tetratricopeptide (TPR) repeat protein
MIRIRLLLLLLLLIILLQLSLSIPNPSTRWRHDNDNNDDNSKLELPNAVNSLVTHAKNSLLSFFGYKDKDENINIKDYLLKLEKETTLDYDKIGKDMDKAKEFISMKQYYEAVDVLLDILEKAPFLGNANALVGASLLALGKNQYAEGFLYIAIQLSDWSDAIAIGNLAESFIQANDIDLAEKVSYQGLSHFKNINETDTTGFLAYSLGNINKVKLNYQSAADWYLTSALNNPENIQAWLLASTTMFPHSNWDYKFAENVLYQALQYHRTNPDIVFKLGYVLHTSNPPKVNEAITLYEEALNLKNDHGDAMKSLATAYHSIGRYMDAIQLYDKAMEYNDQDVTMLSNYAILLLQTDNDNIKKHGISIAQKAYGIDPSDPDVIKATNMANSIITSMKEL